MSTTSNVYGSNTTDQQQKPGQQQTGYSQQADNGANLDSTPAGALQGEGPGAAVHPSAQYRNQQPHVGDVGPTSGTDATSLPEQQAKPEPYTGAATDISESKPSVTDPVNIQQRLNARDPPVPYPESGSGAADPTENQDRNQQSRDGGVADLGNRSDGDVSGVPEERANPDPVSSQATSGGYQDQTWQDPGQKSWDGRGHTDTAHDVTKPGHSGGITGSNHDVDHGLGMPHRADGDSRDETAVADSQDSSNGPMDYGQEGNKRETRPGDESNTADLPSKIPTGARDERQGDDEEDDNAQDNTGADDQGSPRVSKIKKIQGSLLIAKGTLTKDQEDIDQGKHLKQTGEKF